MNICNDGHSEIVYTDWTCPLCDLQNDFVQLRKEYEQLEEQLDTAETELSTYYGKSQHYHSILADIAPEHII